MRAKWLMLGGLLFAQSVWAGGSPLRTLVVVNSNSDQSLELGRYYAAARGIPDRHIVSISTFVSNNVELTVYSNTIESVVRAYIADNGLSNQIDHVVFSMDIPYRVVQAPFVSNRIAGLTAAFYYGFFSSPDAFVFGCDLAAGSANAYFEREVAFDRQGSYSSNRLYLSAMLTASNLPAAKRLIDRSVLADESHPPSSVLLMRTTDNNRNVQWVEFEDALFLKRFVPVPETWEWLDADLVLGRTNIMGISSGARNHNWLFLNTAMPGAFGQHLTSFGGFLFDPINTQMSILDWIQNGYSGSHGTVVEPCAYTNKFATPRFHYWYARGFSLGESLWMSVRNPYQGIFVGDPLCAPYARSPNVEWVGVTNGTLMSGMISLTGKVNAASTGQPIAQAAWFRNGRWQADLTNSAPRPGNVAQVVVNGTARNYTVNAGDSVVDIAAGMAGAINAAPPLPVNARAMGDRLEIRQKNPGTNAEGWTVTGSVSPGTASVVTIQLNIPTTNFLETTVAARELVNLIGNSVTGDIVRATITRFDGGVFTNQVVVTTNASPPIGIMNNLAAAINGDTNLQASIGCYAAYSAALAPNEAEMWLFARTNTWEGYHLEVQYEVIPNATSTLNAGLSFTDNFNDNEDNLLARAMVFVSAGATQMMPVVSVDTTTWPDGPHALTLTAVDGSGVQTEGRGHVTVVVDNHDLSCVITSPVDRVYRLKSGVLTVEVATSVSPGSVTQVVVFAEGKSVMTGTMAVVSLSNYGAGPLHLQAQAWDDAGQSTLSEIVTVNLFTDMDGDGVSDQWEYENFGAFTNLAGTSDIDGDGVSNHDEFYADTQPTNGASFLAISGIASNVSIQFATSTDRLYRVRYNNGDLLAPASWYAGGDFFAGDGGVVSVPDAATTNAVRFYAVEPKLPE